MTNSVPSPAFRGGAAGNFTVMLPCSDEEFGSFISSLLGKPQTIEKVIRGAFEVDERSISNIYHLVDQRINQQNEAQLIQFTVTIVYDDDSTHLLNSLEDFQHYTEIKPLVSVAVHLSWSYLVRFHKKKALEKQVIEMSLLADSSPGNSLGPEVTADGILVVKPRHWMPESSVFFRISHTERTWGVDMESLLTGHVRSWVRKVDPIRLYIARKAEAIGFVFGLFFFLGALGGVFLAGSRLVEHYSVASKSFSNSLSTTLTDPQKTLGKIDFLTDIIVTGVWPRFIFNSVTFLCIALLVSILFGTLVSEKASGRPRSFILLSQEARNNKERVLARGQERWRQFFYSIIVGIATGVAGNIVFAHFFSGI